MKFGLTKAKTIVSLVLGLIPGVSFSYALTALGPFSILHFLSYWLVPAIIIYVIWSLFQKKK